jgi:hypothetical protein
MGADIWQHRVFQGKNYELEITNYRFVESYMRILSVTSFPQAVGKLQTRHIRISSVTHFP